MLEFNAMIDRDNRGFTLLELIIVILVIGILASLALPNFGKSKEVALGKEAKANLQLIQAAEKIYKMERGGYYPINGTTEGNINNINDNLRLSLTELNWDYTITTTGNPATTFNATADRNGTGGYLDCNYIITQSDTQPTPNSSCP